MSGQDFLFDVKTDKVGKGKYIKLLKTIIGDATTNCNRHPMKFRWLLTDTGEDRTLGVMFNREIDNSRWLIKKLEQYGLEVVTRRNNPCFGNMKDIERKPTHGHEEEWWQPNLDACTLCVRIIEEQDCA